ncbi:unnamed protein product [Cuscuta campestris]|uniref:serine O-acetyltransferase n=1 Tax=Cuscuta campestris TaxID=132261 RepID=A0A484MJ86_9ASTE|nr:unnamed protein product [Cuscuta campestris]
MREALKSIVCPKCDGEEERKHGLQLLMMENVQLKEEHERLSTILSSVMGRSAVESASSGSLHEESNYLATTGGSGGSSAPIGEKRQHETVHGRHTYPMKSPTSLPFTRTPGRGVQEMEKGIMIETVAAAMEEVVELLQADEPLWTRSPDDEGRLVLHRESYDKLFAKGNCLRNRTARTESSKDSGIVAATPVELIQMCLDPMKWMDFFPTIVHKARIIEVVDSGILGGSLQLMYEKMHILSPMVAPRDFVFLRYCQQLEPNTWVMVDVSYDDYSFKDLIIDTTTTSASSSHDSWRLPSGCLIRDLHNGKSMVTWVEHVQVDDKLQTHCLYKDLIRDGLAYGAKRWIAMLQRMSERYGFFLGLRSVPPRHELEEVINAPLGRRNMMQLSHRMVRTFYETLSMPERKDSAHENGEVRVSLRRSNQPGQPDDNSLVVCAAASLRLPLPPEHLFDFFKDDRFRSQWDVLSHGYPVTEIARISTGTHPGNCVSIIQELNGGGADAEAAAAVWRQIREEAKRDAESEPVLASHLHSTIISHSSLFRSLSFHLSNKLSSSTLPSALLCHLFLDTFSSPAGPSLRAATAADLCAARFRDPACTSFSHCLLNYKGFLAIQAHRLAHDLWLQGRKPIALSLQSRTADVFAVDIHPAARIGRGMLLDHATGVVIGETATVGNNVSMLHNVTLGGTGKLCGGGGCGDRHPKIGDGVLIGAGATILGNVEIGEGAKIGAGSVVLIDVPPWTTAVGSPARVLRGKEQPHVHEDHVPLEFMA